LIINDQIGAAPRIEDNNLRSAFVDVAKMFYTDEEIHAYRPWNAGCTDMGDISTVMPSIIAYVGCSMIPCHTKDFVVEDAYNACVVSAKLQAGFVYRLLSDNAYLAKKAISEAVTPFKSIKEYLTEMDKIVFCGDCVFYNEDGSINIKTE